MKKIVVLVFLSLLLWNCKQNQENKSDHTGETEETVEIKTEKTTASISEWEILFNGTNYDHWRGYGKEDGVFSEWTIEDGAMAFIPGKEGGKNIISRKAYTNFVLSLEWKISEAGNSGIFWGVHESEEFNEAYQTGPEIQVLDDAKHPDAKVAGGLHKAGALYDMIKAPDDLIKPAGEWNEIVLKVNHKVNLAKVGINGRKAYSFPVHGDAWNKMVANSKFKDWKGFGVYQTGHIGLQDHGDKVWYRNIKIRSLD